MATVKTMNDRFTASFPLGELHKNIILYIGRMEGIPWFFCNYSCVTKQKNIPTQKDGDDFLF